MITTLGLLLAVWVHYSLKPSNGFIEKPKHYYDYIIGIQVRLNFVKTFK